MKIYINCWLCGKSMQIDSKSYSARKVCAMCVEGDNNE
jgi:hypothetical protein